MKRQEGVAEGAVVSGLRGDKNDRNAVIRCAGGESQWTLTGTPGMPDRRLETGLCAAESEVVVAAGQLLLGFFSRHWTRACPELLMTARGRLVTASVIAGLVLAPGGGLAGGRWRTLAPGLEVGVLQARHPSGVGDSRITVVRIDPAWWELRLQAPCSDNDQGSKTAREWAKGHGFAVVTNAGMFDSDGRTHLGSVRVGGHRCKGRPNPRYLSVVAFDPLRAGTPRYRIYDLDTQGVSVEKILADYASLVQNLRLIKRPGENRWSQQERRWSEAALGEDKAGRILFIFCRSPYSMHDLNRALVGLGIGLVAAQHLEGGPEAQLYVHLGGFELEQFGSYETGFNEKDGNASPWPVPNVLGVMPREAASAEELGGGVGSDTSPGPWVREEKRKVAMTTSTTARGPSHR